MSTFEAAGARTTLLVAANPSRPEGIVELCRTLRRGLLDPYRPERHYMRGPGPKCREKARLAAEAQAGASSAAVHRGTHAHRRKRDEAATSAGKQWLASLATWMWSHHLPVGYRG